MVGFGPVVDGLFYQIILLIRRPRIYHETNRLMTGWNEDEYTFFAWERKDTSAFTHGFCWIADKT